MPGNVATTSANCARRYCCWLRAALFETPEVGRVFFGSDFISVTKLGGDWKHHRDCHIEPDWLLIYKIDGDDLYLVRTGTHSDIF